MTARTRRRDAGFSFVEVLAYMAIFALLAVAAVPQFSNYRRLSTVSQMQTDARAFSSAAEAQYTIGYAYPATQSTARDPKFMKRATATGQDVVVFTNRGSSYTIEVSNPRVPGVYVVWDSARDGLQPTQRR